MGTVQIVAIAVAAALVLLLIVALLVTRRSGRTSDQEQASASGDGSFLDQAPQDTFAGLGKVEKPVEDVTLDPASEEIVSPGAGGREFQEAEGVATITDDTPAATSVVSAGTVERGETITPPASEPGEAGAMVLLSDIIVTTSNKLVDLRDADVRRMLTDLVKLEVDQAIEFRRQGQTVDAVMQLTEAEKISHALSLHESAQAIHAMIEEMNRPA